MSSSIFKGNEKRNERFQIGRRDLQRPVEFGQLTRPDPKVSRKHSWHQPYCHIAARRVTPA